MRYYRAFAMLMSMTFLLSACAFAASPAEQAAPPVGEVPRPVGEVSRPAAPAAIGSAQPVTITFITLEEARGLYQPLVAKFEKENPDIRVQLTSLESIVKPTHT